MSNSRKELERAFKLIKRDKTNEALDILRPIVNAEPENVDAWWLLAYAATEPREVRESLVQVLRLDPFYSNAPKARDMLQKLNEEYPPSADEIMKYPELQSSFPDVFAEEEDIFAGNDYVPSFVQPEPAPVEDLFASDEPTDDLFGDVEFEEVDDSFLMNDSAFADLDNESFVHDEAPQTAKTSSERSKELKRTLQALDTGEMTDEEIAALEEKVGRRQGRGRRLLLSVIGLILIVALVGAILFIALPEDEPKEDPGALQAISLDSDSAAVQASVANELRNTPLGSASEALFAESELGDTLFIKICGRADSTFPQLVTNGMDIAAQQVSTAQDTVDAVGITVEDCEAAEHDTLYRAVVSVADAMRYQNGELDRSAFQKLWKTA